MGRGPAKFLKKRTGRTGEMKYLEIRGPDRTRTKKFSRPADRTGHGPRKLRKTVLSDKLSFKLSLPAFQYQVENYSVRLVFLQSLVYY